MSKATGSKPPKSPVLLYDDIFLDRINVSVTRRGKEIRLRSIEFRLLTLFMEKPRRIVSRFELCRTVWNSCVPIKARTIDVSVGRLRKALCTNGGHDPLRTIRGVGFALGNPSNPKDPKTVSEHAQPHPTSPRAGHPSGASAPMRLRLGSIEIVRLDHVVRRLGRTISLAPKPFAVFDLLFSNAGRAFSREQIAEAVWGKRSVDLRTVDAMVGRVRKAINGDVLADPIRTMKGLGYKFNEFFEEPVRRKKLRLPFPR